MPDTLQPVAIVCASCGGDPRASQTCKMCGGAGIGVASPDGFLVWSEPVDEGTIFLRKMRRTVTQAFHVLLFSLGLGSAIPLIWRIMTQDELNVALRAAFWTDGHWTLTLFWAGILLDCFLVFRLIEYSREEKPLPTWKLSKGRLAAYDAAAPSRAAHRFDVGPFFSRDAREILETSYTISKDLRRTEIRPEVLFAAALTSSSGGIFRARLAMDFDKVKEPLAKFLVAELPGGNPPIALSRELKRTLALAYADARSERRQYVGPMELLLQSFKDSPKLQELFDRLGFPPLHVQRVAEWIRLQEQLREDHQRFVALAALKPKSGMNRAMTALQAPLLDRYSQDLTLAARAGQLSPLVGRARVYELMLQGIESGRRSVVLVGETGVGKTALVDELARRMVEEDVPPELFDRRLVSINLAQLVAAGDPSLAAERLFAMLQEVGVSGNIILVAEGIEALTGFGGGGPMDLAEMFASELQKGYFITIATTTPDAWTSHLERRTLGTKLIRVDVPPLEADDALRVLMAKSGRIEVGQKVFCSYAALEKTVALALRYIHEIASPENALNILREAAVRARKARGERTFVTAEDVATVVQEKTRIPVEAVGAHETEKLLSLEDHLHARLIGQHEAVTAVAQSLRRARAELREGKRPIANFLFLGPTGVGKTELAKSLAAEYFGDEKLMIRQDMSEYQDRSSVTRLIGAPGDQRGGLLTEAVRHNPFSLILLDEIEKANPDILNLFLQVMDDGRLTDGVGRTVDFTNAMVIMTSNAGTSFIQEETTKGTPLATIKTALIERELKGLFRPEFLNRFDGIILFKPLTQDEVAQIAWLQINAIAKRLEEKAITFTAEDTAVEQLARDGFDPLFGARPLRRVIQDKVENGLADLLLRQAVGRGDRVRLQADGTLKVEKG
ncbi:ATP-dependent Clp protease ATP-binding subunit [Candidatus Uhrbacteria bacterium]|nr:ATP-dependent Clp protease ATP-binding subunit [Candidatus Uhrbacteria bacterium]